jgi:hypothetical protein
MRGFFAYGSDDRLFCLGYRRSAYGRFLGPKLKR